jgi:hypothetical protein
VFYRLLGIMTWKLLLRVVQRKAGVHKTPRGRLIGVAAVLLLALVAGGAKARSGGGSSQLTP